MAPSRIPKVATQTLLGRVKKGKELFVQDYFLRFLWNSKMEHRFDENCGWTTIHEKNLEEMNYLYVVGSPQSALSIFSVLSHSQVGLKRSLWRGYQSLCGEFTKVCVER